MSLDVVRAAALALPHGFLGRQGGVSGGALSSLNMGLGAADDLPNVAENRRRGVAAVAPGRQLVTVYQVHGAACATVAEPWSDADRPQADALVTDRAGIVLGILTADCAPVLLADVDAGVIAAAHAGWRGAVAGVTDSTLVAMEALGAERKRIIAAIGPCIGRASYEVSEAFADAFAPEDEHFFSPGRAGHLHFDLPGYVAHRLAAAGVSQVDVVGLDTLALPDRFFSYRRATLTRDSGYGRQISLIALPQGRGR